MLLPMAIAAVAHFRGEYDFAGASTERGRSNEAD
jgi:hypothetical protein